MPPQLIDKLQEKADFERMDDGKVVESRGPRWTRAEDYVVALARKRSARREHQLRPRTQPEAPRLLLSTIPFVALISAIGVLAFAIMIVAFPGTQPRHHSVNAAPQERGVAARGWYQEAKKEFHS